MVIVSASAERDAATLLDAAAGGSASVDGAIERAVEELVCGLHARHTDLGVVAKRLGVRLEPKRGLPFSAGLQHDGKGLRVIWAKEQGDARRRFSIAHELGHAYLETQTSEPPRAGRAVESLCDRFAAELLMPSARFRDELGDGLSIDLLLRLSRRYGASLQATAIRCAMIEEFCVFVADRQDLLWRAGRNASYNEFLRQAVSELYVSGGRIRRPMSLKWEQEREDWVLQGQVLPWSRDAILLLTPVPASATPDVGDRSAATDRRPVGAG